MKGKIAVGALLGALLMSSVLVGVSRGQDPGRRAIAEPNVLELVWHTNGPRSDVLFFLFDEGGGRCGVEDLVCGQLTEKDMPLYDVDGNEIGRQLISCTATDRTGWQCQLITKIQDGPHTDKGQVIANRDQAPERRPHPRRRGWHGRLRGRQRLRPTGGTDEQGDLHAVPDAGRVGLGGGVREGLRVPGRDDPKPEPVGAPC